MGESLLRTVHLLRRESADQSHPIAFDLLESGSSRVIEMFDAPLVAPVADLSLAERDLPEVISAIYWAQEIHAHRLHPEMVLRGLPPLKPEELTRTPLVLHGPWTPLRQGGDPSHARLKRWPGVVKTDGLGSLDDVHPRAAQSIETFKPVYALDLERADALPRACGATPIDLEDGRWQVTVIVGAQLSTALRSALLEALRDVWLPRIVLLPIDERSMPRWKWAVVRRAAQVYITTAKIDCELLEAAAQQIPIIIVDEEAGAGVNPEIPRDEFVYLQDREPVDRVLACIRSWSKRWEAGEPAMVDARARKAFLDLHTRETHRSGYPQPWSDLSND